MKTRKNRDETVSLYYNNGEYIGELRGERGAWELFIPSREEVGAYVSHGEFKTQKLAYNYAIKIEDV